MAFALRVERKGDIFFVCCAKRGLLLNIFSNKYGRRGAPFNALLRSGLGRLSPSLSASSFRRSLDVESGECPRNGFKYVLGRHETVMHDTVGLIAVTVLALVTIYLGSSMAWLRFRSKKIALRKERLPRLLLISLHIAQLLVWVSVPFQRVLVGLVSPNDDTRVSCFPYYACAVLFFPVLTGPFIIRAWVLESHIKFSRKARNMALNELSDAQRRYLTTLRDRTSNQWGVFAFVVLILGSSLYGFGLYLLDAGAVSEVAPKGCICHLGPYGVAGCGGFGIFASLVLLWYYKKLRVEEDKFGIIAEMRTLGLSWISAFAVWITIMYTDPGATQAGGHFNWSYVLLLVGFITHGVTVIKPIIDSYHGKLFRRFVNAICCVRDKEARRSYLVGDTLRRRFTAVGIPTSRPGEIEMQTVSDERRARENFRLDDVLSFPVGIARFEDFLTSEFCVENLQFWLGVQKYKSDHASMSVRKSSKMAHTIFKNFVQTGATWQVNISDVRRREIQTAISAESGSKLPEDLFAAAEHDIYEIMLRDSFPRFKKSRAFTELFAVWESSKKDKKKVLSNRLSIKVRNLLGA